MRYTPGKLKQIAKAAYEWQEAALHAARVGYQWDGRLNRLRKTLQIEPFA